MSRPGARAEPLPEAPLLERGAWRALLVPPLIGLLVLLAHALGWSALLLKGNLEMVAPPVLALTTLAWTCTWVKSRETAAAWLAVLAAGFLCREIHFHGSDALLEATLALLAGWAVLARRTLLSCVRRMPARSWLAAAFFAYFLSQLVARRVFRSIPGEQAVHVALEEMLEDGAHMLLFGTALASARRIARRATGADGGR